MKGLRTRLYVSEIKAHIEDYLRQKGVSLRHPFRCFNPFHPDNHPSMSYYAAAGNVHCFSCGATYDIFDLIGLDYNLLSFEEQYRQACRLFGYEYEEKNKFNEKKESKYQANLVGKTSREEELKALQSASSGDLSYFLSRGIYREICEQYGLFQADDRVYFPIIEKGVCTGWCARGLDDSITPRYKNSSGPLGIWNGDILSVNEPGDVYVTEGIIDAICLLQLGKSALSLCGSQNTRKFLDRCRDNLILSRKRKFIICGDPDEAGAKMNRDMIEGLNRLGLSCGALDLSEEGLDVAGLFLKDRQKLADLADSAAVEGIGKDYINKSAAMALDAFFLEAEQRANKGAVSTGFEKLDELLDGGLYPGLYVIGAVSSLGKTSFVLQMADYMANQGRDVLFFSLEQSRFELMAKSLSRHSALLDESGGREAFTVRQLLGARRPGSIEQANLLLRSRVAYEGYADRLFLREGTSGLGLEEIRQEVVEHLRHWGDPPVVFVDYLQILRPSEPRATDKQNIDRAVVELKRISRDFDLPVVAVSSFNRENYRAQVSMEAFKESGAVEYSSDVLLGLQLSGAGSKNFDYNAGKLKDPRKVELVMLKNRNGIPYAKIFFSYFAKFNLFRSAAEE